MESSNFRRGKTRGQNIVGEKSTRFDAFGRIDIANGERECEIVKWRS